MVDLITARRGTPHVSPKNDADIWRSIIGVESGVFEYGNQMGAYTIGNNVYIGDGVGMFQGRMFETDGNDYVPIELPATGTRQSVVCFKVETVDDIQTGSWDVLYGEVAPSGQPAPGPVIPTGNIDNGETAYLPICSVLATSSSITSIHRSATIIYGMNVNRYKKYYRVDKALDTTIGIISVAHGLNPSAGMWNKYELVSAWITKNAEQSDAYQLPYVDPNRASNNVGITYNDSNILIHTGTSWNGYTAHFIFGEL